jgi:DNA ligase-1
VQLQELVATSAALRETPSRRDKGARLADCLSRLGPDNVAAGVAMLAGEPRQGRIGVGWAALREPPPPADAPTLTVREVDDALTMLGGMSGPGSQTRRRALLGGVLGRATASEQRFLQRLLTGDLRHGALEGVAVEAIARAASVPAGEVRRALMLRGDLGDVAAAALADGRPGLAGFRLQVGRPVGPMLAQPAPDVASAMARLGRAAVEWKLDGTRIQVHRDGRDVRVFTRGLDEITGRVPEVVAVALSLPARAAILDGELVALRTDGRPHAFQVTAGGVGTRVGVADRRGRVPLTPCLFDLLHLDGDDLLDRPGEERVGALAELVPAPLRVPRTVAADVPTGEAVLREALERGHEGVMVKSLEAPYAAGSRGASWLKVKPHHTLDLVVLAAEWGHGRRRGWLSNLHLGAGDPAGGHVMLGKTFKGLTDAMLVWQTERLLELEVSRDPWTVRVRPELVVEVAFDGVQASTRYPGGVALRFARVVRHRPDKPAAQADTIAQVLALHRP